MPHTHRFHVTSSFDTGQIVALPDQEAHHAARVVRVRPGDRVELFDGSGNEGIAVVERLGKRDVDVRIAEVRRHAPPAHLLSLAQAWPNHDKTADAIIRRGVELGVTAFIFFRGAHSERAPSSEDKWDKTAIESCKQCRRVWLPDFRHAANLAAALDDVHGMTLIATTDAPPVPIAAVRKAREVNIFVGPEGDFNADELDLALARGAHAVALGPTIFRSEVAVTVALALIQYERGLLGPRDLPDT